MMTCGVCGNRDLEGELFCSQCGARLPVPWLEMAPTAAFVDTSRLRRPVPGRTDPLAEMRPGQIVIAVGDSGKMVKLEGRGEYLLGREGQEDTVPDLDLSEFGGREKGVSRIHAALRHENDHVLLIDLGSTNGTRLNGTPLPAHQPVRVTSGDEIKLGRLPLRVHFGA